MKTNELTLEKDLATESTTPLQNIDLVKGEFSLNEASEVIMALLDQKLNFHKAKKFQLWTRDNNTDTSTIDNRIAELQQAKAVVRDLLESQKDASKRLYLHAGLDISVIE